MMETVIGLLIPFLGTSLGAGLVFFLRKNVSLRSQKALNGFASGVMIAASVWSLLIPAMEMTADNPLPWLPAAAGFLAGVFFLLLLDRIIPHFHAEASQAEGPDLHLKKATMLFLAVTIHNIPEGMAVGAVFAGLMSENTTLSLVGAMALSIGIAIQNFPEGAIVSAPMREFGFSKPKAFFFGVTSGAVEPVAAFLTVLLSPFLVPVLPGLLAFAAGAMIYVVVEELIPDSQEGKHSDIGTICTALGFTVMMVLDVALG